MKSRALWERTPKTYQKRPYTPLHSGFLLDAVHWFLSHLAHRQPVAAPLLPDDAREQLRQERLLAQHRLNILSSMMRRPW